MAKSNIKRFTRTFRPGILAFALLFSMRASACLNIDGTALDGGIRIGGSAYQVRKLKLAMAQTTEHRALMLAKSRPTNPDGTYRSEETKGVIDVIMGKYENAIGTFKRIESENPGLYSTAANLGTAYELHGDLELALQWITEGIKRNPESHWDTEWLHVGILKTRIKLRENPDYLKSHHIVTIPESLVPKGEVSVDGVERTTSDLGYAFQYQLSERMEFVKPKDPAVADLLFSYGMLVEKTGALEAGVTLLQMAREYGFHDEPLLAAKIRTYERIILFAKIRYYAYLALALLAVVAVFHRIFRRRWFFQKKPVAINS